MSADAAPRRDAASAAPADVQPEPEPPGAEQPSEETTDEDDLVELTEDEETIRWLEAQLDEEVAEGERRAAELRREQRRARELETQLAGYRAPFAAFPGGCGVDVVVFARPGEVPEVARDYAEHGHRVFLAESRPDAGDAERATTTSHELAPGIFRVLLPSGADVDAQVRSLDELTRRAAIYRAVAIVEEPSWATVALAAQSRLAWKLAAVDPSAADDDARRLAANADVVLRGAEGSALRGELDERLRDWYPRVAIVVVSFDNHDYLELCLASIFEHTRYPSFEVIVVDNGSTEGTAPPLARPGAQEPRLRTIASGGNVGFARACNLGIEAAPDADVIVLLNDDTVVTRGWLGGLIRHLGDTRIGEVGPVTNYAGNEARVEVEYDGLEEMHAFAEANAKAHPGELVDLPMLAMFCVALRASTISKVGLLDERFSIGMYEDDDYAMRLRSSGYRIACARDVFVHHWGGASFRRLDPAAHADVHETHSRAFSELWGRPSAGVERSAPPRDRPPSTLERFAGQLEERFGGGPVAVVRGSEIGSAEACEPAAVLVGDSIDELAAAAERAGATLAFRGRQGRHAVGVATPGPFSFTPPAEFDVTAFVPVYNEADVLRACVAHHLAGGVRVHLLDNWSSDGGFEIAQELARDERVTVERFPLEGPTSTYAWSALLSRIEILAAAGSHDWAILADADEIRLSPWPGRSIREALWAVREAGFNAVDHTVISFPPVDDTFAPGTDPATHFRHAEFWTGPGFAPQIKAWRRAPWPVRLVPSGGHEAEFAGRRVFPFNFLDRHYPIRSQAHGERKVFEERVPRWAESERRRGWHAQYDRVRPGERFTRDAEELIEFDEERFVSDHLVACLSRIGIGDPPIGGAEEP